MQGLHYAAANQHRRADQAELRQPLVFAFAINPSAPCSSSLAGRSRASQIHGLAAFSAKLRYHAASFAQLLHPVHVDAFLFGALPPGMMGNGYPSSELIVVKFWHDRLGLGRGLVDRLPPAAYVPGCRLEPVAQPVEQLTFNQ